MRDIPQTPLLIKAASRLAEIWRFSAKEQQSTMGNFKKFSLCVHISQLMLEKGMTDDQQVAWFRNNTTEDSPLKGRSPMRYMTKGYKGIVIVDNYITASRGPMLS